VRERLKKIIEPIGASSKRVYTVRGKRLTDSNRLPVWNRVKEKDQIVYRINRTHPALERFLKELDEGSRSDFDAIIDLVGSALPLDTLFADMGEAPGKVSGDQGSEETLGRNTIATLQRLLESGFDTEEAVAMMEMAEPFRSHWERVRDILEDHLNGEEPDV
jgi:hypothetical protein